MGIEQGNTLYLSLKEQANKLKASICRNIESTKAREILDFCNNVNDLAQSHEFLATNPETLALLLDAEEMAYRVLPLFAENLPLTEEVNKIVETTGKRRAALLAQLRRKYPYAIRSVHNPHLYLPLLKRMNVVYGETAHPVEEDAWHEAGHFSRQLAQRNAPNFTPENEQMTEFLAIIHRDENGGLGFQPVIIQDDSALSLAERIAVTNEEGDLSEGDKVVLEKQKQQNRIASFFRAVRRYFAR